MYPSNHWGDWNDSQLLPTIQKLMKGYNRYLRPNFNGNINNTDAKLSKFQSAWKEIKLDMADKIRA